MPWESRTEVIRWGFMMVPPLATPAATSAICSGVACTSFCPMDAWASLGGLLPTSVGKTDLAGSGRSMGAAALNPHVPAPESMSVGPMVSVPISANAELQDSARIFGRAPPQRSPPKLLMALVVWAGR